MKTWETPKICSLGLDMTLDNTNNAFTHYCHSLGTTCTWYSNDHSNINSSANKDHLFTSGICDEHGKNNAEACCCYVATSLS